MMNWINTELTSAVFFRAALHQKSSLHHWIIILLFIPVKLLWNNLYCIKRYINKGDLTWLGRTANDLIQHKTNSCSSDCIFSSMIKHIFLPADVNECELLGNVCGEATCENREGTFLCLCPDEMQEFDPMSAKCFSTPPGKVCSLL